MPAFQHYRFVTYGNRGNQDMHRDDDKVCIKFGAVWWASIYDTIMEQSHNGVYHDEVTFYAPLFIGDPNMLRTTFKEAFQMSDLKAHRYGAWFTHNREWGTQALTDRDNFLPDHQIGEKVLLGRLNAVNYHASHRDVVTKAVNVFVQILDVKAQGVSTSVYGCVISFNPL
jgi:hypothetical protein